MGPRSVSNMVFIVLLAAALIFGLWMTSDMVSAAMGGPG